LAQLFETPGQTLPIEQALKGTFLQSECVANLFKNPRTGPLAKKWLRHLASHDGNPKSISSSDIDLEFFHLYGEQWKENWSQQFLNHGSPLYYKERIRKIGHLLLSPQSSKVEKETAFRFLASLKNLLQARLPVDPERGILQGIEYFLDPKEPEIFSYLKVSFKDFMAWDDNKKIETFQKAIRTEFPKADTVGKLFGYLSPREAFLFRKVAFETHLKAALTLFETGNLTQFKPLVILPRIGSGEADFFPNLPQDTPYPQRQKALDSFLGPPVLIRYQGHYRPGKETLQTVLKKYLWIGNTEVFSIESEKPGPTTLVFSPHFHEDNPRKMFHWTKDIPLQSGRLILIPEANRALGLSKGPTDPMNGLFNNSLTGDRIDYTIVRRVEFLMGLVDGMVGLHDSVSGPFYISDLIRKSKKTSDVSPNPVGSPWVPQEVKNLQNITFRLDKPSSRGGGAPNSMADRRLFSNPFNEADPTLFSL
jgi:hypothetical protein